MEYYKRIEKVSEHLGYKSINSFSKEGLAYSSAEKINRLKKEGSKPSIDILLDITNKFDQINPSWLLSGKGEMLNKESNKATENDVLLYLRDNIDKLIKNERFMYVIDYIIAKKEELNQKNKLNTLFDDFRDRALKK